MPSSSESESLVPTPFWLLGLLDEKILSDIGLSQKALDSWQKSLEDDLIPNVDASGKRKKFTTMEAFVEHLNPFLVNAGLLNEPKQVGSEEIVRSPQPPAQEYEPIDIPTEKGPPTQARVKFGTYLREDSIYRLKLLAIDQEKKIFEVLQEAVDLYLSDPKIAKLLKES